MKISNPQKSDLLVSVVSPIHNAGGWIADYLRDVSNILSQEFKDYEIVLVDNASQDETITIVEQLQAELKNIQVYCLARSIPHESAFIVGLENAIGDVVITMDAAYDPVDPLIKMIDLSYSGINVIYGLRNDRINRSSPYHFMSRFFFRFYRYITKEDLPIAISTLRLYTRRAINSFLDNSDRYSLFPVIAAFSGLAYTTFNYQRINRTGSLYRQSYSDAIARALRLVFLSSHYPLRLLSVIALLAASLNIIYSFYVILINIFKDNVAEGWTTLSLQNSLMFFILFMILSVLSEYISRLFLSNQNRPFYLIDKESRSLVLTRKNDINVTSSKLKS
ncbi:glycosyltransferase [Leptolyngbya sp. AN02str]|uniref:glycosyltransferase n=1 Tax=Leptolyngbya sp. AN02str TaxID=3423363 RepID=UPI003D312C85